MKTLAQVFVSACLSLALVVGVSFTLTGCSADTLSGPDVEAYATGGGGNTGGGGGTTGTGSPHNTWEAAGGGGGGGNTGGGGGTTGTGSPHNL